MRNGRIPNNRIEATYSNQIKLDEYHGEDPDEEDKIAKQRLTGYRSILYRLQIEQKHKPQYSSIDGVHEHHQDTEDQNLSLPIVVLQKAYESVNKGSLAKNAKSEGQGSRIKKW